jgi:DHHC palmitoyltransferase
VKTRLVVAKNSDTKKGHKGTGEHNWNFPRLRIATLRLLAKTTETLHYTTPHYTTPTLHYTTLHYTTRIYIHIHIHTRREKDRTMRVNGFQRPFDSRQVGSWVTITILVLSFYLCSALVLSETAMTIAKIGFSITFLVMTISAIYAMRMNPVDPMSPLAFVDPNHTHNTTIARREADHIWSDCCPDASHVQHYESTHTQTHGQRPHGFDSTMMRWCQYCHGQVRKSSKHCIRCDKCIHLFDHHCRWLNNCIGLANYRAFLIAVVSALCLTLQHTSYVIYGLVLTKSDERLLIERMQRVYPDFHIDGFIAWSVIQLILLTPFLYSMIHLLSWHIMLIRKNTTTYDYLVAQEAAKPSGRTRKTTVTILGNPIRFKVAKKLHQVPMRKNKKKKKKKKKKSSKTSSTVAPLPTHSQLLQGIQSPTQFSSGRDHISDSSLTGLISHSPHCSQDSGHHHEAMHSHSNRSNDIGSPVPHAQTQNYVNHHSGIEAEVEAEAAVEAQVASAEAAAVPHRALSLAALRQLTQEHDDNDYQHEVTVDISPKPQPL